MRLAVIFSLCAFGCAGTFTPDLGSDDSSGGSGSGTSDPSATASISSTSVGTGMSDTSHPGDTSAPGGAEDTTTSTDASESSGAAIGCGDGMLEGDEECDGDDLGQETCLSRGMPGGGMLRCFEDCTYDVSACSLGGPQPLDGLWSACSSYEDCPAGDEWDCEDNFCSTDCTTVADCGPSPGGSAVAECRLLAPDHPEMGGRCYLGCEEEGAVCPTGMVCWGGSYCRSIM